MSNDVNKFQYFLKRKINLINTFFENKDNFLPAYTVMKYKKTGNKPSGLSPVTKFYETKLQKIILNKHSFIINLPVKTV